MKDNKTEEWGAFGRLLTPSVHDKRLFAADFPQSFDSSEEPQIGLVQHRFHLFHVCHLMGHMAVI